MKIANLKIGTRLGAGFGLVLVLMIVLALVGVTRMQKIEASLDGIVNENYVMTKAAFEMRQAVLTIGLATRNIALMKNDDQKERENDRIFDARDEYDSYVENLDRLFTSERGKAVLAKIAAARAATDPLTDKVLETLQEGKQAEAITMLEEEVWPQQKKWLAAVDEMVRILDKMADNAVEEAHKSYKSALILTLVLSGTALVLGIGAAWLVTRSITKPLHAAVDVARRVAKGDLTAEVRVSSKDETGQLMEALKEMNDSLLHIVEKVRAGTQTITTGSTEIANGNQDLSSRTEQQASSLQETASSMEELTSTVKQNAENARQANVLARSASDVAAQGGAVVSQVVDTMGAINASAKKISDIIGVIDGIAFQTNILALNAAVEAARAGEQGRGFAVVASEVRNLAQRSASAAKEIKALIQDSVEKVGAGSQLVDKAGTTMQDVVTSVKRVTDIMDEIASASIEQTAGIEQINQAILQMDQVTQQNAALVEQAAAAAEAMQDQAAQLAQAVNVFKLSDEDVSAEEAAAEESAAETELPPQAIVHAPRPNVITAPVRTGTIVPPSRSRLAAATRTGTDDWEEF